MSTPTARQLAVLLVCLASAMQVQAGEPSRGPGERKNRDRGFMPTLPIQETLDTDRDGKLSAAEIQAAPESLKKLDKNKDGKLSAEEIGWPPRAGGRGGFFGGPPFGGPPFGGERGGGRSFAQRLLARDANGDGKVTADELPTSMPFLIQRGDANRDGALDRKEIERLAEQLGLLSRTPEPKAEPKTEPKPEPKP